jgi:CarD family transcriptional regulator
MRSESAAKARSIKRATSKEVEAKLRSKSKDSRNAQESPTLTYEMAAPSAAERPGFAEASLPFESIASIELPAALKPAAPAVKVQKTASEDGSSPAKSVKVAGQRLGFKLNEFVVYPAHGVGQIMGIEEQEVAGFRLELFVINFSKDKLTLRVPTSKVSGVGMRKISDADTARRSLEILTGRARVKRTMWSRRAQEYETKINSGDINAIAEVVRDLYRSEAQPEQSYSERQLYEAALDRIVREIAVVQKSNEIDALKMVEAQLQKGQSRASKSGGAQGVPGEIEQAA